MRWFLIGRFAKIWDAVARVARGARVALVIALARRFLLHGVLPLLVLAAAGYLVVKAVPAMVASFGYPPWDGFIDWGGAREMLAGRDPYSPSGLAAIGLTSQYGLGHPPTTLIWFYPFAHLDREMMRQAFTVVTLVMLLFHAGTITADLQVPGWPLAALLIFAAVFQTDWFIIHLFQVDLSELIAFLYVLCWYFLRRERDVWAGAMAGLACTLKLYPGLMLLFLVVARRWRAVGAAGIAYALFSIEVVRRLGFGAFRHFLEQTGSYADLWVAHPRNASITGLVHRLVLPVVLPVMLPVMGAGPESAKRVATIIVAAVSLVMLLGAWLVSARRIRAASSGDPTQIDLPFALFSVLSMAPGPYQWEHYHVTLILPFVLLADSAVRARGTRAQRWSTNIGTAALLTCIAALLQADLGTRDQVFASPQSFPRWKVIYYDVCAWFPWLLLSLGLAVRMLFEDRIFRVAPRSARARPDGNTSVAGNASGAEPSLGTERMPTALS